MKVVKRKVSRWFVNGKGYASETQAYLALAKQALVYMLLKRAVMSEINNGEEAIKAEYVKAFPVQDPCPFPVSDWIGEAFCHCTAYGNKAFCNKARWEWLRAKAKELKEQDAPID